MKYSPLVSVVVPVYNTEKYLEKCLDSICGQSYKNIEIICINDGSTDNSGTILNKYAMYDSRIVVVDRTEASGSAALPRNIGIKQSGGEYIAFIDSDDYLETLFIEKMICAAREHNADLVLCSNYMVDKNDVIIEEDTELHFDYLEKCNRVFSSVEAHDCLFQISNASVWHRLYKKSLINDNQFFFQENTPILDDIFFVNATLVAANRICIIQDRLIYYRDGRSGSQTSQIEKHYESVYLSFAKLIRWMKKNDCYDTYEVSLKNWILSTMMWWYSSIHNKEISERVFYLYRNEYFVKLNLNTMTLDQILPLYEGFFIDVTQNCYHPPLGVILNSMANKRLAVYGAGRHGRKVIREIEEYESIDVVLWCDSNYEELDNKYIRSPQMLKTIVFDSILIAVRNRKAVNDIKEFLIKQLGIPEEIIFSV